jgi:uncharacterized protein YbcC (UPF0753/DUF2309 family)
MQISNDNHELIISALKHIAHLLPDQAPIQGFVHHNPLHGYQHLSFEDALAEHQAVTGINAYLPESCFRDFYAKGRINDKDIATALARRYGVHRPTDKIALLVDLSPISVSQFTWQIEELDALNTVQTDVPETIAKLYYRPDSIRNLWTAILNKLDLQHAALHPETLLDLSLEQTENWFSINHSDASIHEQTSQHAKNELNAFMASVGEQLSLRDVVLALSGKDVLDVVRPRLIRLCASVLDEGVAAWHTPEAEQLGLYAAWRANTQYDISLFLHELPDWQQTIAKLPDNALDAIILHLTEMDIPSDKWAGYLQRTAQEIAGWAGMIQWREQHPNYQTDFQVPIKLADFLAVRLTLDRLWLQQICHNLWKVDAKLSSLQHYFRRNLSEFRVRHRFYQGELPEYLSHQANSLITQINSERSHREQWQQLADLIWMWQFSPIAEHKKRHSVFNSGWRLFRLSQHLGLQANDINALTASELLAYLDRLDEFNEIERSKVWLDAYEHHYQQQFFSVLRANHGRGRWAVRDSRPEASVIFCMDEREESFRRHLEEHNPNIETLGAAGFFGVAMNYQGLHELHATALCPVAVTPSHKVQEIPLANTEHIANRNRKGGKLNRAINRLLLQNSRTHLFLSHLIIDLFAPVTFANLLAKNFIPNTQYRFVQSMSNSISPTIPTQLHFNAIDDEIIATPEQPRLGFTNTEQADCVANSLRAMGLTDSFAPLVVLFGHGSISQNNPHHAAYNCSACDGRHGGANARLFAAMANRPEMRHLLAERDIHIPAGTWFIGAEHDTCNENIDWYDLDNLPIALQPALNKLQANLAHTQRMSAHERCRRLMSAPRHPTPEKALKHIQQRASDFSQVLPELGNATNAAAIVGRRSLSQGTFLDRRVFLISYDPTQDDTNGKILESILLTVVPVGVGINLEYYFSTVSNEYFGCGSKVGHNLTGFFGIMEGTSSDLRTGLPQQVIEIHEATRLQLLIEAKTSVLEAIYERQDQLRELIAGGWLHLSAKDPDSSDIYVFERGTGFVLWQTEPEDLPIYEKSPNCYKDKIEPVAPALIKQP